MFQANVATRPSAEMPERVEHASEPAGALRPVAVGRPFDTGTGGGDDLLVSEVLLRPIEQMRDRERSVLHQPVHERRT